MCYAYLHNRFDYCFGFNGQEKDNEVKGIGNSLSFEARIYDSRLGRWLSTDPMQKKYPNLSPYNAFENNPIVFKDKDGRDATYALSGNTITVTTVIRVVGASDVVAKDMKRQIDSKWGGNHTFKGEDGKTYNIKFETKIVAYENVTQLFSDKTLKPSDNVAYYSGDSEYRDNVKDGRAMHLSSNKSTPHEYGHLLGLDDRYFDIYTNKNRLGAGDKKEDWNITSLSAVSPPRDTAVSSHES